MDRDPIGAHPGRRSTPNAASGFAREAAASNDALEKWNTERRGQPEKATEAIMQRLRNIALAVKLIFPANALLFAKAINRITHTKPNKMLAAITTKWSVALADSKIERNAQRTKIAIKRIFITLMIIFFGRRTPELSGNTGAEASACRLLALPSTYHSNGLELSLPQTNLS